jgi:hypothetical protein
MIWAQPFTLIFAFAILLAVGVISVARLQWARAGDISVDPTETPGSGVRSVLETSGVRRVVEQLAGSSS